MATVDLLYDLLVNYTMQSSRVNPSKSITSHGLALRHQPKLISRYKPAGTHVRSRASGPAVPSPDICHDHLRFDQSVSVRAFCCVNLASLGSEECIS